jgi:nucleoside transporter
VSGGDPKCDVKANLGVDDIFAFVSELARNLLGFADQGTSFLTAPPVVATHYFLVSVLPAIIFFVALVQLLYHLGIVQWFIGKFAVFFFWSMRVSGAEAVVAAASPFIGQGESAILIKPFVAHLTQAELHQIMCSGFATIAGSVLIAYISLGVNGQALVSSCIMSIPASLAISKLRYPETEETLTTERVVVPDNPEQRASNSLHAFANGAWLGLKIAGMILATLLCIIALLGLANGLLTWWGRYLNINDPPLTVELIVGYICYPIAFLLGVPRNGDLLKVGKLIGTKLVAVRISLRQTQPPAEATKDSLQLTISAFLHTERVRRLHGPSNQPGVCRPITSLPSHRNLCPMWLCQHRVPGHPGRCPESDCPRSRQRRKPPSPLRAHRRSAEHINERQHRRVASNGPSRLFHAQITHWVGMHTHQLTKGRSLRNFKLRISLSSFLFFLGGKRILESN